MNRTELKTWVKEKIKGHRLELFITILVAGFLTNLTIWQGASFEDGVVQAKGGISLGIFFYFVEVGLAYYMVKFLNDKEYNFKDLFYFSKDLEYILPLPIKPTELLMAKFFTLITTLYVSEMIFSKYLSAYLLFIIFFLFSISAIAWSIGQWQTLIRCCLYSVKDII